MHALGKMTTPAQLDLNLGQLGFRITVGKDGNRDKASQTAENLNCEVNHRRV